MTDEQIKAKLPAKRLTGYGMVTNEKICPKCKRNLPLTEFYKNATLPDGLQSFCKQCGKDYRATRAEYVKANRIVLQHRTIRKIQSAPPARKIKQPATRTNSEIRQDAGEC